MDNLTTLIQQIESLSPENRAELAGFVAYLKWKDTQKSQRNAAGWSFSFIEAFKVASVQTTDDPAGMDVKMALAEVGGQGKPALWAHPPVVGQSVIEYHVPVPRQVTEIRLKLSIGIRDGAQIATDNLVAFGLRVNGARVWGQQTNKLNWQDAEIPLNIAAGDMVKFEFTTEALGSHEWTWAVWGNPELTGKINE